MKTLSQRTALAVLVGSLVFAPIAEAKRVGGGRSTGMTRSSGNYNSGSSYNNISSNAGRTLNNPYGNRAPAPATVQQNTGSNMGKVVAAGVAGAAIGAVAGHAMANNNNGYNNGYNNGAYNGANGQYAPVPVQQQNSGFSWFWLLILGGLAFFLYRRFARKKALAPAQASTGTMFGQSPSASQNAPVNNGFGGAAYTSSGNTLPDGTEPAAFLRFARQRFNHIQAMNSASNINEIQRYFTPDMFQAIQSDIVNNDQTAEFDNLNAQVVDQSVENGQYVASVRFSGTVSEDLNSAPQPFSEVWHFVKPAGSTGDWLVAGIQQN